MADPSKPKYVTFKTRAHTKAKAHARNGARAWGRLHARFARYNGPIAFQSSGHWQLAKDEWKSDIIPEIMDGKNIADFIDPDIMQRLEELEAEEERREAAGEYSEEPVDPAAAAARSAALKYGYVVVSFLARLFIQ
jgi:hypothetical protein